MIRIIIPLAMLILLGMGAYWGTQSTSLETEEVIRSEKLDFRVETVVADLDIPWAMAFLPNGDMLFTERKGSLRLVQQGELHPKPIGGVPKVRARGQGGLLDLELHPQYAENGWIYLSYSSPIEGDEPGEGANTALMRAKIKDHQLVEQEVIFKALPNYRQSHHYGGRIIFDQEGYLYLSVGDRGGRDENQTLTNYRGKIFRLNDDGSIPEDNPFVEEAGAVTAIWSWGHRNPQGLSLHPETGEVWEHEHGPKGGDELNLIQKGRNYGWPTITYGINYIGTKITDETHREGMEQPQTYWVPSIAPCGMDFVEDEQYGAWQGNILIGSLSFRYLERVELKGHEVVHQEKLLEGIGRVRAIEQAPDGYMYVAIEGPGKIVRLVPEK
ncbi:MAG: PQQ-dependent sugar dehydrogenase [Bacteroidota bacterium]